MTCVYINVYFFLSSFLSWSWVIIHSICVSCVTLFFIKRPDQQNTCKSSLLYSNTYTQILILTLLCLFAEALQCEILFFLFFCEWNLPHSRCGAGSGGGIHQAETSTSESFKIRICKCFWKEAHCIQSWTNEKYNIFLVLPQWLFMLYDMSV